MQGHKQTLRNPLCTITVHCVDTLRGDISDSSGLRETEVGHKSSKGQFTPNLTWLVLEVT